jgi:hypothetical protein
MMQRVAKFDRAAIHFSPSSIGTERTLPLAQLGGRYLLAMELRAMRKRIGFVLSDAFRRSLLETRTLTNSNNSEVVLLRDFLSGNQV